MFLNDIEDIQQQSLSIRDFDNLKINLYIENMHLDKNLITKVAQQVNDNLKLLYLKSLYFKIFLQKFKNLIIQ